MSTPIDLPATLHGGQAFRWRRSGDEWVGPIGGVMVNLRETPRGIEATGRASTADIKRYFRVEPADIARRKRLARDPVLSPALAAHPGLRLLRQDPWEATVAFLTSANNNVLRIQGIIEKLCARYGDGAVFPSAESLARAREADLRACGLGYRAPFLKRTARMALDLDLMALRGAPLGEIREALLPLPGVGPKVADCIALFSLDADGAFPVDRWVLRAMGDAFFGGEEPKPRDVVAFAGAR
ncbi:MAG: DNA glycosylase, partial [Candidatus Thermoplasmatota archaeon]